jgi:hypothetical protein
MPFISYRFLEDEGIVPNRTTLSRSIAQLGFPKPVELGANRLGWDLDEVRAWLASRPGEPLNLHCVRPAPAQQPRGCVEPCPKRKKGRPRRRAALL